MTYRFETVDVFTERRFGGNPLAVFPEAEGLTGAEMQLLAAELNLSETTFVLPPAHPQNTARMRIFNRTAEMPFAGHPSIGTAVVLARSVPRPESLIRLEVPAGVVEVELERQGDRVVGGRLHAPQPLTLGREFTPQQIAACVGISPDEVIVRHHQPVLASVGVGFVIAEVDPGALTRCVPDLRAFGEVARRYSELGERFSLHLYAGGSSDLKARMFAPLAGTMEDPATGSANAALTGLLLTLSGRTTAEFTIYQGQEMGRPSVLHSFAHREGESVRAGVSGRCMPVLSGIARVRSEQNEA